MQRTDQGACYGQLLHTTKATQDNKIEELKELISGIAYQQSTLL
jgi:hypothetical protein